MGLGGSYAKSLIPGVLQGVPRGKIQSTVMILWVLEGEPEALLERCWSVAGAFLERCLGAAQVLRWRGVACPSAATS